MMMKLKRVFKHDRQLKFEETHRIEKWTATELKETIEDILKKPNTIRIMIEKDDFEE